MVKNSGSYRLKDFSDTLLYLMIINAPAKLALYEAIREIKKPQGAPKTTSLGVIKKQLKIININDFDNAIRQSQDRDRWKGLILEYVKKVNESP